MRSIFIAQALLILVISTGFLLIDEEQMLAALYGGSITLINSLLMARRIHRANKQLAADPTDDVRSIYFGALERFLFTLIALAVGMGWLWLSPPALLLSFAVAHLGYPLGNRFALNKTQNQR